jgi:gluconate 2-dehydrogenase gamma chain
VPSDTPPPPLVISRRDLLRTAGALGAAAITADAPGVGNTTSAHAQTAPVPASAPREAYERLTAREADTLEAIVARLIPSDANGPGATEARAAHYIDRALAGALAASLEAYRSGLAALDRYAVASRGTPFGQLAAGDQDAVLMELEKGTPVDQGFPGGSSTFFALLKGHTWQGTFGDPYYGGNANFVGWDLLGYPGVRTMVTEDDQRQLEQRALPANHRSAYDYAGFTKATAQSAAPGDHVHGD